MHLAAFFLPMGTNIENATETAENGGGQAGTRLLTPTVIALLIVAVLQLVVALRNVIAQSHFAVFRSLGSLPVL